jgi:glycine cleavage system aminomethyltransferase T
MTNRSLEDLLQKAGNPVRMLRHSQTGPYAFPVVRPEFTNWRDEQRAWRQACALMDQSHHMTDLYVEGRDAMRLLSDLGINSFKNFQVNQAKQFVACTDEGYVIGDAILFHLEENRFSLVGRPPASNWVQFHAETGGYDVKADRDERSAQNEGRRKVFRFELQGPHAVKVMEKILGRVPPEVRFFHMDTFRIGGVDVRALRHGMVGEPGWELFGPWEQGDRVRDTIAEAGREFGLRLVGSRAYPTTCLESGWIPSPLPAIYSGEKLKAYRQWLTDRSYEAMASLGGSYESDNISDYYLTPYDLGYGKMVKFDHDFVGRAALERMAGQPHRRKMTLVWNNDDVQRAYGSVFQEPGKGPKYIDLPLANYSTLPFDAVVKDGRMAGLSTYTGFSSNERSMLSLAMLDAAYAEPGTQVAVVWGEKNGGSSKPTVERHQQIEIRATVQPAPISEIARVAYRPKALA